MEDKKFKEQEKEIDYLQRHFNEISDDFLKEIIKINSNFITCINDKFEEIKKNINQEISIHFNKQFEEILNHIKNEIINKCIENQDKIKMEQIIKDIKKIQNNNKEYINKNQDNNNFAIKRKKDNNYLTNENQNNAKKKENINPEEPLNELKIIKMDKNLGENNRNTFINC